MLADKRYDGAAVRDDIEQRGGNAMIPTIDCARLSGRAKCSQHRSSRQRSEGVALSVLKALGDVSP